jgi:hypothetical protein
MTDEPISDYTIKLNNAWLQGTFKPFDLFNGEELKAAVLEMGPDEGISFTDYVPFAVLEPYTTYVLWLGN